MIPDFKPHFQGTNFGHMDYDAIVLEGLMKVSCGYHNGHTLMEILKRLNYIMLSRGSSKHIVLTRVGEMILYRLYEELRNREKGL